LTPVEVLSAHEIPARMSQYYAFRRGAWSGSVQFSICHPAGRSGQLTLSFLRLRFFVFRTYPSSAGGSFSTGFSAACLVVKASNSALSQNTDSYRCWTDSLVAPSTMPLRASGTDSILERGEEMEMGTGSSPVRR